MEESNVVGKRFYWTKDTTVTATCSWHAQQLHWCEVKLFCVTVSCYETSRELDGYGSIKLCVVLDSMNWGVCEKLPRRMC
jgi:hypothetical protein